MNKTFLLSAIMATAVPLVTLAEDTASPTPSEQTKEENSCCMDMGMNKGTMMGMTGMRGMGSMMSNLKEQDAELDNLITAMNSSPADKKLDAIATVVTKLVEQRKAAHEAMQKMMARRGKAMMKMGCMMMMQADQEDQE